MKVAVKNPKLNEADLANLPSEFCRHGYREIMRMQGGSVVWGFLKPILTGKILYTPKNLFSDAIVGKMNGTFTYLSSFVDMLQAWAQTISSLESFYSDPNANERITKVQHLVVQLLGKEVEGLFDDVDTSNLIQKLAKSGAILGLVQVIGNVAQCIDLQRFIGFSSEFEMEEAARTLTKNHEFIAGIVFNNLEKNGQAYLPTNIEYKLRIDIDFVPSSKKLKDTFWEPGPKDNYISDFGYMKGFVEIQEMLDRAITAFLMNRSSLIFDPAVHLQQFPYSCYQDDRFGTYIRALAPLFTTIAWIFLIAFQIRERVLERELHLEEVLRVMGLRPGVAWLTWFMLGFGSMAFGAFCSLGILKLGGLVPNSDFLVLFAFFLAFSLAVIMYW